MQYIVCMKTKSEPTNHLALANRRLARETWGDSICRDHLRSLRGLTVQFGFSVERGELRLLQGNWYVTHSGLLHVAQRSRCFGIRTLVDKNLSDPAACRWVFKAIVYKSPRSRGFVGYGDADPSNIPSWLRGCELRIAETRAVNRALRKAYGIGLCSVEELGCSPRLPDSDRGDGYEPSNGSNGQPRLRDRLSQLIRQHRLDASLVKCYAAEFCGTQTLRDASRQMVEDFIQHLAEWAIRDRDGLLCHLNRYSKTNVPTQEVHS